jgi:hypothetical protein
MTIGGAGSFQQHCELHYSGGRVRYRAAPDLCRLAHREHCYSRTRQRDSRSENRADAAYS